MKILGFLAQLIVGVITMQIGLKLLFMIFGVYDLGLGILNKPIISESKDPLFIEYALIFFIGIATMYVGAIYEVLTRLQRNLIK